MKNNEFIVWECEKCNTINIDDNHPPQQHYKHLVCESCMQESPGCKCDQVITPQEIDRFFSRQGMNKSGFCREADVSQQHLNNIIRADEYPITKTFLEKILKPMYAYGFRRKVKK